jgi:hypothetical protein
VVREAEDCQCSKNISFFISICDGEKFHLSLSRLVSWLYLATMEAEKMYLCHLQLLM